MLEESAEPADSIGVYCPECGQLNTATRAFSDGNTHDYEAVCEQEEGSYCVQLLVTVTLPDEQS